MHDALCPLRDCVASTLAFTHVRSRPLSAAMDHPPFVHPDYWALLGGQTPPPPPETTDPYPLREMTNTTLRAAGEAMPYPAGMRESVHTAVARDGAQVRIKRFEPLSTQQQDAGAAQRAVVFAFGGGHIGGGVDVLGKTIAHLAEASATQLFAVDYRLSPEHPYPAALDDVCAAVAWLQEPGRAAGFRVNPARVVLFGISAGGNLCAGAALRLRDEGHAPRLAAQVLRYPMLDDRTTMGPDDPRFPYLAWTASNNKLAWSLYLSQLNGGELFLSWKPLPRADVLRRLGVNMSTYIGDKANQEVPYHAAPARAEDLHNLPPALVSIAELDLFREENEKYVAKLKEHGVEVETNMYHGVPHGFDGAAAFTTRDKLWEDEARFIKKL